MAETTDLLSQLEKRLDQRDQGVAVQPYRPSNAAEVQEVGRLLKAGDDIVADLKRLRADLLSALPMAIVAELLATVLRINLQRRKAARMADRVKGISLEISRFKNGLERFNNANGRPLPISRFLCQKNPLKDVHFGKSLFDGIFPARKALKNSIMNMQLQMERVRELFRELKND